MLQSRSVAEVIRPSWGAPVRPSRLIVPRPRLTARLDDAIRTSPVVIVDGEAGSGKTALISAWVGRDEDRVDVRWCSLRSGHAALELDVLADEHDSSTVVVVDDAPIGPDDELDAALERLLVGSAAGVRVVLLAVGDPALDLQRLGAGAECRAIGAGELALDTNEIAAVLERFGGAAGLERFGGYAETDLVTSISDRTCGWAWGVRRVVSRLARGASPTEALRETELAIAGLLEYSILRGLPEPERRLLTETSMVEEVTAEHVLSLAGNLPLLSADMVSRTRGFVRVHADGSFTTHPLLRRHLLQQLRRNPTAARTATRHAVRRAVERGEPSTAVDLCLDAADWTGAAELLIESLQIPRLLAAGSVAVGTALPDRADVLEGLGAADPLLKAVIALGRSWPDLAAQALREAPAALFEAPTESAAGPASVAARLSRALVAMSLARWQGDPAAGQQEYRRAAALVPQLSVTQRAATPMLAPLLHAHLAAFDLANGASDRTKVTLERGARAFRSRPRHDAEPATQLAAADCLGQLAWIEAVGGSLTSALHRAAEVLTARPADSCEVGVVYAQLATIWCQISRIELEPAVQRFESLSARCPATADVAMLPELTAAMGLTAAKLAAAVDHERIGPQRFNPGRIDSERINSGRIGYETRQLCWSAPVAGAFDAQLHLIRAEAELDAGEPSTALRLLGESGPPGVDAQVLRARAWIQLGDRAAVAAALRVRPVEAPSVVTCIGLELVEGWLTQAHGDQAHLRSLVERALRTAQREQLRTAISWAKPWLHDIVTADHVLLQRYGPFLASIRRNHPESGGRAYRSVSNAAPLSPLTEREIDVLQRLGSFSSNEEIATDLYLSPNTIKTHLRSLYRKLEVTRRSDAFRRGRALGLC